MHSMTRQHTSPSRAEHDSFPGAGPDSRPRAARERLLRLVRVGQTHVGRGVFARRRLKAGMVLGEILGTVLDEHPADPSYCMEVRSGRVLEPDPPLRFVNHSCDPNCELFYWTDDDGPEEDRLWLQTIRSIEPGEELSIDYCWPADAAIPCHCGNEVCRGWIVDPEERHLLPATPTENLPAGDGSPSRQSSS
ncbi:MAG: SET domain-containing protein [Planctomycetia bacterium]|nr:SET domain-containing protein [Planctomycetia bacterium]